MSFERRGMVLAPSDLAGIEGRWLDWMSEGSLNVLGLHSGVDGLIQFVESPEGSRCLSEARSRGIEIEFEIHAIGQLLPRSLFGERSDWFRANDDGARIADANFCVSNADALSYVAAQAAVVASRLRSDTNLYYLWADDALPWCRCEACRDLSPSDQNLTAVNAMANALSRLDSDARLAYLAYWNTLTPPTSVQPESNVFLEYAPIKRNSAKPLDDPDDPDNAEHADNLQRLVKAFDMSDAKVLEYWMDASRYSNWRRPSVKAPFYGDVFRRDAAFYASLGFRSATSFGVFMDADYFARYGAPPVAEYGRILAEV